MTDRAYATMLTGGDTYLRGVEALGRSLVETGTKERRIVLVTPDVSGTAQRQLVAEGWELQTTSPLPNPHGANEILFDRYRHSFTKLRVFGLEGLERVVFLDADTIVLRNIDDLFSRPTPAAAPDFFTPDRFNSGVMVIEPSRELFSRMLEALAHAPTYDGGDQGFLNWLWPDWWAMPVAHRLPSGYNLHHFVFQFMMAHEVLRRQCLDEVRVVHYTLQKPWMRLTLTGGAEAWWEKFYGAHPEESSAWRRTLHQLQDYSFDSLVRAFGGR
jgi:hypothetical protein